jgi:hypothetical protein
MLGRRTWIVAAAMVVLGCDRGTPALSAGGKGPAPRVVWNYPEGDAKGVPLVTSIRVQFDRFLAPGSTMGQAICVQSCSGGPSAPCEGPCLGDLSPEYDPVDRVVVWKNAALVAGVGYRVRILAAANDDDPAGIRAIDGAPLEKEYAFDFTAGDASNIDPKLVEAENVVSERAAINFCSESKYCQVPTAGCTTPTPTVSSTQGVLEGCAVGGCHGLTASRTGPPGSVLLLRDPDGGVPAAVGRLVNESVVATETAVGPDPSVPVRGSAFGVNMPYIDGTTKSPGNSFLLYKVILGLAPRCGQLDEESANPGLATSACTALAGQLERDEFLCTSIQCMPDAALPPPNVDGGPPGLAGQPAHPIVPAWVPDDRWKPPIVGEYDRLRSRIRGAGMPPSSPIPSQQARALSAWIAAGASVSCP